MIINRREFIKRVQIDQATLDIWLEQCWLLPNLMREDMEFSETDLARGQFILDLREKMGVNEEGVGVVLNLVDQMHGLRAALDLFLSDRPSHGWAGGRPEHAPTISE